MTYLAPSLHYEFSMNITQTQFKGSARYIILVLYEIFVAKYAMAYQIGRNT